MKIYKIIAMKGTLTKKEWILINNKNLNMGELRREYVTYHLNPLLDRFSGACQFITWLTKEKGFSIFRPKEYVLHI